MTGLDSFTDGLGKVLQTAPQIYEDGLKPSVQEVGKTIAVLPKAINACLAPIRIWIAQQEYNVEETERILAKKLERVSPSDIVSPEAYVAVPTIQAISYCKDSEELRNMYANLLATSMLHDKKQDAHPSFVEIIKQLSPDEAKLLKKLSDGEDCYPLIDVNVGYPDGTYDIRISNYTILADGICDYPDNICEYIDNLSRLKIIDIKTNKKIAGDEVYFPIESSPIIKSLLATPLKKGKWRIERRGFGITNYGIKFINTCVRGVN